MKTNQAANLERREQNRRRNEQLDARAANLLRREQNRLRNERLDAIAAGNKAK